MCCSKTLSTLSLPLFIFFRQFNFNVFIISRPKLDILIPSSTDQIWIAICHDGMCTHDIMTSNFLCDIFQFPQIELQYRQLHRKRSMNDDFYNVGSCDSKYALSSLFGCAMRALLENYRQLGSLCTVPFCK